MAFWFRSGIDESTPSDVAATNRIPNGQQTDNQRTQEKAAKAAKEAKAIASGSPSVGDDRGADRAFFHGICQC